MKIIKYIIFGMGAFALLSCNGNSEKKEIRTDTLEYSVYKAESASAFRINSSDTIGTYSKINYPNFYKLGDTALINKMIQAELIKSHVGNDLVRSIPDAAMAFVMQYDSMISRDKSYAQYWNQEINMRVVYQEYPYVSFAIEFTEYTGGAHGMYGTSYINYDRAKNRIINLNDLFEADELTQLNKQAEQIFRKQEGLKEGDDYSDYFFENGKFVLPNNFSIRKGGIVFHYGLYEIKPYVSGVTEVFVPRKDEMAN
jgi:Deacetylase PdaC/Protein of unknown function (DUF3298)